MKLYAIIVLVTLTTVNILTTFLYYKGNVQPNLWVLILFNLVVVPVIVLIKVQINEIHKLNQQETKQNFN